MLKKFAGWRTMARVGACGKNMPQMRSIERTAACWMGSYCGSALGVAVTSARWRGCDALVLWPLRRRKRAFAGARREAQPPQRSGRGPARGERTQRKEAWIFSNFLVIAVFLAKISSKILSISFLRY